MIRTTNGRPRKSSRALGEPIRADRPAASTTPAKLIGVMTLRAQVASWLEVVACGAERGNFGAPTWPSDAFASLVTRSYGFAVLRWKIPNHRRCDCWPTTRGTLFTKR